MKRSTALVLALVMLLGMAVPAFAADEGSGEVVAPPPGEIVPPPEPAITDAPAEPTDAPAAEPTDEPAAELTDAPAAEPTDEPAAEPTDEPAAEPTDEPAAEPTDEPAAEPTDGPVVEPTDEPAAEPTDEPVVEPTDEPVVEPTDEPAVEPTEDPDDEIMLLDLQSFPSTGGQVDVSVTREMDLGNWIPEFKAILSGEAGNTENTTVTADGARGRFEDLPAGTYTLTVEGDGFETFTQSGIKVEASTGVHIRLTIGQVFGYASGKHPGVLRIGDVNGDGAVNADDGTVIMQCVAAGGKVDGCTVCDLNGDGVVDLVDAEYVAKGMYEMAGLTPEQTAACLEHFVPESAIMLENQQEVSASGLENMFRDDASTAQIGRADNEPISAAKPLEVSFGMADNVRSDAIVLENTNITAAKVEIVYEDENGELKRDWAIIGDYTEPAPEPVAVIAEVPAADVLPAPQPEQPVPSEPEQAAPAETVPVQTEQVTEGPAESEPFVISEEQIMTAVALGAPAVIDAEQVPGSAAPPASLSGNEIIPEVAGGRIEVKLGTRVAVKRVTFVITATTPENLTLAEISHVEFVNGMEERIGEPQTGKPENVSAKAGSRQFTVNWSDPGNVTGFEVQVWAGDSAPESYTLTGTSLTVTNYNKDEVLNYTTYSVQVRSLNGSWHSEWVAAAPVTPTPSGKPDKPDNVKATGGFASVAVSWKNMKDTEWYNLYYKEESAGQYTKIGDIKATSFVINGLDSTKATTYLVYVTGENRVGGESGPSLTASATTVTLNPPDMPKYNLINQSGNVPGSTHISYAVCSAGASRFNNAADDASAGTAWCTVDGSAASYYERATWDDGGFNWLGDTIGLTYTFDAFYTMDTIAIMVPTGMTIGYAKIHWWDESGADHRTDQGVVGVQSRQDSEGRGYYFLRLPGPITTNKIQIGLSRPWVLPNSVSASEVYFYNYDPLKKEAMELYADDLHTTLREGVTEDMLNELEARIDASVDGYGNVNPDKDLLKREVETAREILRNLMNCRVTRIHDGITASGDEHGFGGLNAWQPLGVAAAVGDQLTVYVGHSYLTTGSSTSLKLIVTQYHAESDRLSATVANLKVGPNQVTIPKFDNSADCEAGGALYVEYTGGPGSGDSYAVRVSGGVQVPVLDLYKVPEGERLSRVSAYLSELSAFDLAALHAEKHQGGESPNPYVSKFEYDPQNCILGSSDIMMDTMMLSIPAQQILAGTGGDAQTLLTSLDAMEDMMGLFYQHKGLNAAAPKAVDQIPRRHLNIRYMRMFSGAFMYASGNHIGVEWPETKGLTNCGGVSATADGLWQSGNYFGWGVAHEIGHDINQGSYAIAEITNNYFAVLAQAHDTNDSVRFKYDEVYKKVTSGTKGSANNVFTQLGMYWQLHLAYDSGYNFRTYSDYDQQLANLFWARVDTYARTPSSAPNGLTLEGADSEQILMRLCCAAARKNILDFFVRWGKTPDEGTIAYANTFEPETRAIYYVCDDSRRYTINGGSSKLAADGSTAAIASVTAAVDPAALNQVHITITPNGTVSPEEILGYEIVRCTVAGGVTEKKTVGFATTDTFTDTISAMNNRAVSYEVTLVDQYLNRSAVAASATVKVQHEGDLDKSHWTVTTAGLKAEPIAADPNDDDPDAAVRDPASHDAAAYIIDGKADPVYTAVAGDGASIEIDFHETQVITGFRYAAGGAPITGYNMEVRQAGAWIQVITGGTLGGDQAVYFPSTGLGEDGSAYVSTYAADAIRLTLTGQAGQTITVAEMSALGLTGDNIDFTADGSGAVTIGTLAGDFEYGTAAVDVIPAGSLVFVGSFRGNAAYNVVMLYDAQGQLVTGRDAEGKLKAHQIILADVPVQGAIHDVKDGRWIYWIEPEEMLNGFETPAMVRAELYRVNNAQTNEGSRLVSDSLLVSVPSPLGQVTLSK